MFILIPLGGKGERFKREGYERPKALINVFGKPIIFYLLESLKPSRIVIPYNKEYLNYNFEDILRKNYPRHDFHFKCLEEETDGAVETVMIGLNSIDFNLDEPVLCLDSDSFYHFDPSERWDQKNSIMTFISDSPSPIYSYITISEDGILTNIREKEKISDFAVSGAYGFEKASCLLTACRDVIDRNLRQKSEFYMSSVVKLMMESQTFRNIQIDRKDFVCLGTPLHVKLFYNSFPVHRCDDGERKQEKKRFCFDLDNTLVTYPTVEGDYTTVLPIERNIKMLRYLKRMGNEIIIYTARRMRTHNGSVGKVVSDIGMVTLDTLRNFEIPYDEIHFGKPHADFYIDDLGVNPSCNLETELGYYRERMVEPRSFNSLVENLSETITKKGSDLSGEIHYYENIPDELKDLFPIYFFSESKKSYTMERIKGVTVTEIYLSEQMTETILESILGSITRIQNSFFKSENIDIYSNYSTKLESRYKNYDYSKFPGSKEIYKKNKILLEEYESSNSGRMVRIHGDPVFSNIIVNSEEKLKFIDMRGKIGDRLTCFGDWLYDWAKIYQSLIGYDEILEGRSVSTQYKIKLINCFEKYFLEHYSKKDLENLKNITVSLIFSLIPLHDNEKCQNYYKMLFSKWLNPS